MQTRDAYNAWAGQYDEMLNKTRDLEQHALHQALQQLHIEQVLELGCGTGKNTGWLAQKATAIVALDFSPEMLRKARQKVDSANVTFLEADLLKPWPVPAKHFQLITCSLVLEHIPELQVIFDQAQKVLQPGGYFYVGELHPFRQYKGKGAHFLDSSGATVSPNNYTHHLSDYTKAAASAGFSLHTLDEHFDSAEKGELPRLVSFLFRLPE